MASELGLLQSFTVYTFDELDNNQLEAFVTSNRLKELTPVADQEAGFDDPLYSRPDNLLIKMGMTGYLFKYVKATHGFHKGRLKILTSKFSGPLIKEKREGLKDGEILSKNAIQTVSKEAKKMAQEQLQKEGKTNIDLTEYPIVIRKTEKLLFMPISSGHKDYGPTKDMLSSAGVQGLSQISIDEGALRNSMTSLLKHQGLISKVSAGQEQGGFSVIVALGGAASLKEQIGKENELAEMVQMRHFDLGNTRDEVCKHLESEESIKMTESLQFVLTNSESRSYYATLSVKSQFSGVGWDKPKGAVETDEGEDYIVDRLIRSSSVMIAFKNVMESIKDLQP